VEGLTLTGHVTWNAVSEVGVGMQLLKRPRWRGGVSVLWQMLPRLEARLQTLFVGSLRAESIPTGLVTLPGYQRVDLALSWQIRPWLEAYFALDNLLGQKYSEQVGLPVPGVRPRLGLQLSIPAN